jgi:hypothetical protein
MITPTQLYKYSMTRWDRIKAYYMGNAPPIMAVTISKESYERIMRASAKALGIRFG